MTIGDAIGWMRKHHPRDTALATVDAVNRRDWEQLRTLLAEDFFYIDGEANRIETPENFVTSLRRLVDDAPDLTIDVDSFEDAGHMVYMRGRTMSEDFRFRSRSMWRAKVDHGRMSCLENFRVANAMRLAKYAPEQA
jgi:hypothetical protein